MRNEIFDKLSVAPLIWLSILYDYAGNFKLVWPLMIKFSKVSLS